MDLQPILMLAAMESLADMAGPQQAEANYAEQPQGGHTLADHLQKYMMLELISRIMGMGGSDSGGGDQFGSNAFMPNPQAALVGQMLDNGLTMHIMNG